jgi:hypothetical protein
MSPIHVSISDIAVVLLSVAPVGAAAYGWWQWKGGIALRSLPAWRRLTALLGICLVTLQALLFFVFWLGVNSNTSTATYRTYRLYPFFLLAVPCVIAGKGIARWVLMMTSIWLFFAYTYLIFPSY